MPFKPLDQSQAGSLPPEHQPIGGGQQYPAAGLIPTVGGALGGIAGRIAGFGSNEAAAGGAAVGAAAAVPIESAISTLQGHTPAPIENLKRQGSQAALSAGSEYAGGIIGDLLGKAQRFIGSQFLKGALPESARVGGKAVSGEVAGSNIEQLSSGIAKRDLQGSSTKLVNIAQKSKKLLSNAIDRGIETMNTVTSHLEGKLGGNLPGEQNTVQKFISEVFDQAKSSVVSDTNITEGAKHSAVKALNQELAVATDKAGRQGWTAVADLKNLGNNLSGNQSLSELDSAKNAAFESLRGEIGKKLNQDFPDLAKLWTDYGFFNRLETAAQTKANRSILTANPLQFLKNVIDSPLAATYISSGLNKGARISSTLGGTAAQGARGIMSLPEQQ